MSTWIGGLPPSAHERIERQRASATAGSLLSAPAAAALRSAGLAPVGEVFGCLVMHLGWSNTGCGWYGGGPLRSGTTWGFGSISPVTSTAGRNGGTAGFAPYVQAFEHGWYGALARMTAEAKGLGADGVVGVRIGRSHVSGQAWEFSALGTAVRATDRALAGAAAETVWQTDLTAEDCAAAMLSGFAPRGMALGVAVTTKHEDLQLKQQRMSWSNTEVTGLTELVTTAREDARAQIARRAQAAHGTQVVITGMVLSEFETPCGQEVDLHAESVVVGSVLAPTSAAPFRTRSHPGTAQVLPVLPLSEATARTSQRRF